MPERFLIIACEVLYREVCLAVEKEIGRQRGVPNGPRNIDIDLLMFGQEVHGWNSGEPMGSSSPRIGLPLRNSATVSSPCRSQMAASHRPSLKLVTDRLNNSLKVGGLESTFYALLEVEPGSLKADFHNVEHQSWQRSSDCKPKCPLLFGRKKTRCPRHILP